MNDPIEHLVRVGTPSGPTLQEALRSFAELRTTPDEGRAVHRLLAREALVPLPEPLLVAVALALVDRGEPAAAAVALARARSTPALMVRADLLERADLPAALALVEQVLARDIDWPGARERHARWCAALGRARSSDARDVPAGVDAVAPEVPFRLLREAGRGGLGGGLRGRGPRAPAPRRAQGLPSPRTRSREAPARGPRGRGRGRRGDRPRSGRRPATRLARDAVGPAGRARGAQAIGRHGRGPSRSPGRSPGCTRRAGSITT